MKRERLVIVLLSAALLVVSFLYVRERSVHSDTTGVARRAMALWERCVSDNPR